jgi:hypothetical protein
MGTKIKQRIRRTLLIPLLLMVAIPFSMLTSDLAQAATPVSNTSSPDRQALSYWYYSAISQCFSVADVSTVTPGFGGGVRIEGDSSKVTAGALFYVGNLSYDKNVYGQYPLATVKSADDGIIGCSENDNQTTKKALSFWGLSGVDVLCGMGYKRENGQSCADSSSTNRFQTNDIKDPAGAFKKYISSKIYSGADPSALSSTAKYAYYSGSLINACTTASASSTKPKDAAANTIYELKIGTNTDGSFKYAYYNATGDHVQSWSGVYLTPSSDAKSTCKAVLDLANNSFGTYASAAACSTNATIAANDIYMSACLAGAANKGTITFCAGKYPNSTTYSDSSGNTSTQDNALIRAACYAGQGNGAAEQCISIRKYAGAELTACINGSNHATDPNYCNVTYPSPDVPAKPDTNATKRDACLKGQSYGANVLVLSGSITAVADCQTNPNAAGCTTPSGGASSCVIEGIGWMICPVFNFLAGVADATYSVIQSLLVTDVKVVSTDSGTYSAWSLMRTFANVGFVIVFLIIIFSQLTGVGVSNYGVKKLLPRIIVAAILVNLSFIVTQVAVDLSNILGGSLKNLLDNIVLSNGSDPKFINNVAATGNTFTDVVAGIFGGQLAIGAVAGAGAAVYFGGAGLIIPIILAAVVAILITLFILVARQALIILLVVIAPLAFLAMLLPNTETYFKQWRKIFIALLLIYPMIALVFGASHLASNILLTSFSGTDNTLGKIVALAVMVLPLFVVPSLLKGSLNAVPAIGSFANKIATRANGLVGKQAKQGYQRSTFGRSAAIRRQAKETYRAGKFAEGVSKSGSIANFLAKEPGILPSQRAANKAVDRTAIQAAEKADLEEVGAAETLMRSHTSNPSQLISAAKAEMVEAIGKGDSVRARAAQNILLNGGGAGIEALHRGIEDGFKEPGSKDSAVGQSMRAALNRAGLKSKNNALASWAYNEDTIAKTTEDNSTYAKLSDVELGGHSEKNLTAAVAAGVIDKDRAARILANPVVAGSMGEPERKYLEGIRGPVEAAAATTPRQTPQEITVDHSEPTPPTAPPTS